MRPHESADSVTIKGTAGGLLVRLHDGTPDFAAVLARLHERLAQGENFFRGARATVDVGRREVDGDGLEAIRALLQQYDIGFDSVSSGENSTRSAARKIGLTVKFGTTTTAPTPTVTAVGPANEVIERRSGGGVADMGEAFDTAEGLFVRRTLRSGQRIQHHGDVVIIGDVNAGAEIVAGGSVLVWGAVRGVVHAGALGDQKAVVGALLLNPTQLRIADRVARAPGTGDNATITAAGPELAQVVGGRITVEAWQPGARRR